jgi:RNA polymerase sigma-70 factor (ECF subfamily)
MQGNLMTAPSPLERLWREHAGWLLSYALSILGDRALAEDALQTVFTRLLEKGLAPDQGDADRAYLSRAVRNESLNALRGRKRDEGKHEHFLRLPVEDPRDLAELSEVRERIERALRSLPDDQREAVLLKTWGEHSFPQIASIVGASEDAAEHRYYRGLAALERMLERLHE